MKSRLFKTLLSLLAPVLIDYVVKKLTQKNTTKQPIPPTKGLPK